MKVRPNNSSRGAALLLFLLVALTMGTAIGVKALNSFVKGNRAAGDYQLLQEAKEALIGYALRYAEVNPNNPPGFLPCPDTNGDGDEEPNCGVTNASAIGWLPWRTLGLPPLRDSSGSCLWYVLSGALKSNPKGGLSTESNGQLLIFDANLNSLNGVGNSEAGLALIMAPGAALTGQNRAITAAAATVCGSSNAADGIRQAQNYLENQAGIDNATGFFAGVLAGVPITALPGTGFSAFISGNQQDTFNDKLMVIRSADFQLVYSQMQRWVADRVRQCLLAYQTLNSNKLPWPALLNPLAVPVYDDNNTLKRFGRIPNSLANTAAVGFSANWPNDPQQSGTLCFNWYWWPNFRETVFYAIDQSISPTGVVGAPALTVDASPATGAVIVAGRANIAQLRNTNAEKGVLADYLETANIVDAGAGLIPPGDEHFIGNDIGVFNDYVCTLTACP